MSEQTVSKPVHTISKEIIEEIDEYFSKSELPIFPRFDKVEFIRTYRNDKGIWEEFKIGDSLIVRVLFGKHWVCTTVQEDKAEKKAFGKRVKYVMKEGHVPWDLAKIAVKKYPIDSNALNFIENVKETLERYLNFSKKRMSMEEYLKKNALYSLGCLTDEQIRIIKEYWLSLNT